MITRRRFLAGAMALPALGCSGYLSGCSDSAPAKMTIGMVTFPGYAPLYVAKSQKTFPGVDVDLVRIESIGDLRSAMLAGRIDMYLATYDIFQSIETRPPVGKMVYAIDTSIGADGVAVDGGIKDVAELVGRKIGAEPGLPPHFVLTYMLYKAGHKLSDTVVVDMPSGDVPSAFASGHVDVAATYEPYLSKCLGERKNSRLLMSSADLPGLVTDFMVVSDEAIAKKPEAVKAVIKGWEKALDLVVARPDETFPIMAKAFDVPVEDMREFAKVVKWLGPEDNKRLLLSRGGDSAYGRYDDVNNALRLNNPAVTRSSSQDFILSSFVV